MEKPIYEYKISKNHQVYYFESIGNKKISKVIRYVPQENNEIIVELIFGNLSRDRKSIDVYANSQNENMPLILSTVMATIFDYLNHHPQKIVYFRGSTPSRTRLYRAAIAKVFDEIEPSFHVFGLIDSDNLEIFNKSNNYIGFIICLK